MSDEIPENNSYEEVIQPITIEKEMQQSYLDYAMSVIVSRALPDVRDGLKPVHRRILFAMKEGGYDYNRPFRKSARIVGDVMGKYHPHGDMAIYHAMVRLAQNFMMRLPMIDGQGNFGSIDGDSAAAMRYTEARMARSAHDLIADIDKDTVDFTPNYDETIWEPVVLPATYPNLLVNGAGGIAVGMATNIPPHNLGEVIDACCALVDNPDLTVEEINEQYVFGPDFPTGGIILGRGGIKRAFYTGRGSIVTRGKAEIEEIRKDRQAIIITEIPYQVLKSRMIQQIVEQVRDKRIEGISDIRDESDRNGMRVVVEIKRDHHPEVVLNQLYKFSALQSSFAVNSLALNKGRPQQMNLRDILVAFVEFREEVITRRTIFELKKAREKAHVLAGLAIAVVNVDDVIKIVREAPNPVEAKDLLLEKSWDAREIEPMIALLDEPDRQVENGQYKLSDIQAKAILDLRLHRLTGMERDKIGDDLKVIADEIAEYLSILSSRDKLLGILKDELAIAKERFATPRRTQISDLEFSQDIEDLIQKEEMVVTTTNTGYIKRVPLSTYQAQRRGGKGRRGMTTKEEDLVTDVFIANTHQPILFFTDRGIVYKMKTYKLPLSTPTAKGKALVNLLPLQENEKVTSVLILSENEEDWEGKFLMFVTASGTVRRNKISDFKDVRTNGKIAMKLNDGESLISVRICTEENDILLSAQKGMCIRFPVSSIRVFQSRNSLGVRGIRLNDGDQVVSMSILNHVKVETEQRQAFVKYSKALRRGEPIEKPSNISDEKLAELLEKEQFLLTVCENGYGKRTSIYEYRTAARGGKGVGSIEVSERNGNVVQSLIIEEDNDIVIVSNGGQIIRCRIGDVRIAGRKTQGVTIFKMNKNEKVISLTLVAKEDEEDMENIDETIDGGGDSDSGGNIPNTSMAETVGESGGEDVGESESENSQGQTDLLSDDNINNNNNNEN